MATFSIIIPVKPGGEVTALTSLRALDPASHRFEILIAEGCSPSRQRNAAARDACGEFIYFLDDDSRPVPDCLSRIARLFESPDTAVVGGPSLTPADDSTLQQLFGCILSSLLGAGGVRNRYRASGITRISSDKELILCNMSFRRSVFIDANGFDERLYPNEENELLDRITSGALKLIYDPGLPIYRSQRRTLRLFIRQMFSYGRGRAQQTLIAGPGTIIGFAPLLLLLYLAVLPFLPHTVLTLTPLLSYCFLVTCFTVAAVISSGSPSRLFLGLLYPLLHISNGWGLLYGLLSGKAGRPRSCTSPDVTVRRIKEFDQQDW